MPPSPTSLRTRYPATRPSSSGPCGGSSSSVTFLTGPAATAWRWGTGLPGFERCSPESGISDNSRGVRRPAPDCVGLVREADDGCDPPIIQCRVGIAPGIPAAFPGPPPVPDVTPVLGPAKYLPPKAE